MAASSAQRLLVIEDDAMLGQHMCDRLSRQGHAVTLCADGRRGLEMALSGDFDLLLLDILLPGLHGLDVLRALQRQKNLPVILMSVLDEVQNGITEAALRADDYLLKPFGMAELEARMQAVLQRGQLAGRIARHVLDDEVRGPWHFCSQLQDVAYRGCWLGLGKPEFRLLRLLWLYQGQVVDKFTLSQHILHRGFRPADRSLEMCVSRLRHKLLGAGCTDQRVVTVWGQGYRLEGSLPTSESAQEPGSTRPPFHG